MVQETKFSGIRSTMGHLFKVDLCKTVELVIEINIYWKAIIILWMQPWTIKDFRRASPSFLGHSQPLGESPSDRRSNCVVLTNSIVEGLPASTIVHSYVWDTTHSDQIGDAMRQFGSF